MMSILFFRTPGGSVIATEADHRLDAGEIEKLCWLYGGATLEEGERLDGCFVGLHFILDVKRGRCGRGDVFHDLVMEIGA